jgi:pimeloyl-ACP methyl ester carboxylesterase
MHVQYLDTDPHASASVPTIMAVHGAPGNFADYAPVIHKLRQKGFRIIAPNFPGMSCSNTQSNKQIHCVIYERDMNE